MKVSKPFQNLQEFEALLPVGYTDGSGVVHRQAVLHKMTGHEEKLLYDWNLSAGELVTELICGCLVRLGDIDTITSKLVSELYTADRNYLLLEMQRITFGDYLPAQYACPGCGAPVSTFLDLRAVPVRRLEDGKTALKVTVQLEDSCLNQKGNTRIEVVLGMPRGVDEEFVSKLVKEDPLQAQDALFLRCIKELVGLESDVLEWNGSYFLRDLTMGDRRLLFNALNNRMPGVDFQTTIHCDSCGTSFRGVIDVTNFFV